MEWVKIGFINIPKRFLKIHKTFNASNLCGVPLYIIAYYNYVNVSMKNTRLSHKMWLKHNPRRQKVFQEKKRSPGELDQILNEHALHWGYVFWMLWRRKPLGLISFIMRAWDLSSTRASFCSRSAQAQHQPLRNAVHLHITSGLQSYKYCCTVAYAFCRNICVPKRLLRQQGLIVPHYCLNSFPPARSDLSSEQSGNLKGS